METQLRNGVLCIIDMASAHLQNHLRANRKRLDLSQEEVAYLLGTESGTKVSRYECFVREPGLRTALAYEAMFHRPIRELFGGLFDQIKREVSTRAKRLALKADPMKLGAQAARKRETLAKIAGGKIKQPNEKNNS